MILLVDVGNSRIKWQTRRAGQVLAQGECATDQADCLQESWDGLNCSAAVMSCVAGPVLEAAIAWQTGVPEARMHRLLPQRDGHGLVNHYEPAERLGPDRYAALVAAHRLGLGDCVVAGVGTALCADLLTREGEFLGGCIVPGPELMRAAMDQGTALVGAGLGWDDANWCSGDDAPRTTAAALDTGIALALAGAIEAMRTRLERRVGRPAGVVLSGGARAWVVPALSGPYLEFDNLVLEGLAWIARDLGYDA